MSSLTKKIRIALLLGVFCFFSLAGALAWPGAARAQLVTSDVNAGTQLGLEQAKDIKLTIKEKAVMIMMQAVMSGLNYFLNKIAYDSAVYLASGGHGQKPFAHKDGPAGYFRNVAGDSLGESLGMLSEGIGLNLCDLPDPRLDLALKLGLYLQFDEPKPLCSWQQLKAAYNKDNIRSKYLSQEGALSRMAVSLEVDGTDFGIWLDAKAKIDQRAAEAQKGAEVERIEGQGYKAFTDSVTGEIKTPASVIKQEFEAGAPSQQKDSQSATMGPVLGAAMQKGAIQVVFQTAGTFVNTLLGTMLKNFMTQGMLPGGTKVCNPGLSLTGINLEPCTDDQSNFATDYYSSGSSAGSNRRAAQEMFNELLVPKIKTVENFELLSALASCDPDDKNPFSCLVGQSFIQILQSAENGQPMTIREALEKGWLNGDMKLIPPSDELNTQWNCAEQAYCHRNLQQLRKLRVLPLGAEIAATLVANGEEIMLKDVVAGFSVAGSRWRGLINPNWLIKLPKMRCNAYVPGQIAANGARVEECVDLQHCVSFNRDGSCASYGYCLKEEQVWTFASDYCDWQNDTCQIFTDDESGKNVSYLARTVDNRACDENNIGCRRYATVKLWFPAAIEVGRATESVDWLGGVFSSSDLLVDRFIEQGGTAVNFLTGSLDLNKNAQFCEEKDAGCSAFKLANATEETVIYLKKAPDYLGCYDAQERLPDNPTPTQQIDKILNGITWPTSVAHLGRIQPLDEDECGKYARVCLPEEAGCNFYTDTLTGEMIPGQFKPAEIVQDAVTGEDEIIWGNQCDAKCAGYDSFREIPGNYDLGRALTYIIPATGRSCSADDAGCTSFTNLSTTAGDFEKVEYFSYLRSCIPPDQSLQKTFYSYERAAGGDLRLNTFVLERDATGAPRQIYRDEADYYAHRDCNEANYNSGVASPDCRRLDDDSGIAYYVNLSKTVLVSDQCTPYRLNASVILASGAARHCPFDLSSPGVISDSRSVEMRDNACYYYGLPSGGTGGAGETQVCSAELNSCHAYKGNAGNNVELVLSDDFENYDSADEVTDEGNWTFSPSLAWDLSTESTNIYGHSLQVLPESGDSVVGNAVYRTRNIRQGDSYILSFWARGGAFINNITFGGGNFLTGDLNVTDVWHYYSFGPVEVTAETASEIYLFFTIRGGDSASQSVLFLDNIRLTRVTDLIYLVGDSLSVDPICDSNPNDNLPGEALGCREYKDDNRNNYYLTGFNYLCRESAIGCVGLIDTFNTVDDPGSRVYNVWYAAPSDPGDPEAALLYTGERTITINGRDATCFVPRGTGGCYLNIFGATPAEILAASSYLSFDASTQYIPADTPTNQPVYLVASEASVCRGENLGCQKVGLETLGGVGDGASFADVVIKNDPALYDDALCANNAVGCRSYSSGGGKYYFKDPEIAAGRVCEFRNEGAGARGWYVKGTVTPCYSNYSPTSEFLSGLSFSGLRSNGDPDYNGSVGECPAEQNGCSEFVDPSNNSGPAVRRCSRSNQRCAVDSDCQLPDETCVGNTARAYFLLNNQKLRDSAKECNGLVSVFEGCVLLDQTSQPNKFWNTALSYTASGAPNEAVSGESEDIPNNANVILKVSRDRICDEWAYCSAFEVIVNDDTGERDIKCHRLGVCDQAESISGSNVAGSQCDDNITNTWDGAGRILDLALYRSRTTAGTAEDYSGYALYDKFQIADYRAAQLPVNYLDSTAIATDENNRIVNRQPALVVVKDGATCISRRDETGTVACEATDGSGAGLCYKGKCLVDITGVPLADAEVERSLQCRAYPETTSPFDPQVFVSREDRQIGGYKSGYDDVSACANRVADDDTVTCDCRYDKYKTAAGDVYLPANYDPERLSGVMSEAEMCVGGRYDGYYCDSAGSGTDEDSEEPCSANGGICAKLVGKNIMNGWQGYCAEEDPRYKINARSGDDHCLTWWPIESVANDFWLMDDRAGYQVGISMNRYQCLTSEMARNTANVDVIAYDDSQFEDLRPAGQEVGEDIVGTQSITYPQGLTIARVAEEGAGGFMRGELVISNIPSNVLLLNFLESGSGGDFEWGISVARRTESTPVRSTGTFQAMTRSFFNRFLVEALGDSDYMQEHYPESSTIRANDFQHYFDDYGVFQHSTMIHRDEIERLTAIVGYTSLGGDSGYISFINNFQNNPNSEEDEKFCGFDDGVCCLENFCVEWDVMHGRNTGLDVQIREGRICDGAYGYWEWNFVDGASREAVLSPEYWDIDFCKELHNNSLREVRRGLDEANGLGIRVIFDARGATEGMLEGMQMDWSNPTSEERDVGTIYAVHLTAGSCDNVAKVAETSRNPAEELSAFNFKPVTWRLVNDSVNNWWRQNGNLAVAVRKKDMDTRDGDEREYGLMKIADDDALRDANIYTVQEGSYYRRVGPLINPFTPLPDRVAHYDNADGARLNVHYTGLDAGVPLVSFAESESTGSYNTDFLEMDLINHPEVCDDPDTAYDTPYCQLFRRMYAQVFGRWQYSRNLAEFIPVTDSGFDGANPVNATAIHLTLYPPRIAAPLTDPSAKFQLDNFSVNGQTSGNIILNNSGDDATVRFYAWADANQAPIRRLAVQTDTMDADTVVVNEELSIGNRKPACYGDKYCQYAEDLHYQISCARDSDCAYRTLEGDLVTGECREYPGGDTPDNPQGFGNSASTGCKTTPLEYVVTFDCPATADTQLASTVDGLSTGDLSALGPDTQVCVFTPRVQVLDNWGWCSGNCHSIASYHDALRVPLDYGCYNRMVIADGRDDYRDDCGLPDPLVSEDPGNIGWIYFNGQVIVPVAPPTDG